MKCKETIRRLSDLLDGELDPALVTELNRHLELCDDCRLVVDTTRKTIRIYCHTEPLPLPAEVQERLENALREKMKRAT